MPRAKRDRVVALTNTKKKTRQVKENLILRVRKAVDEYERLFVFEYDDLKSSNFSQIRQKFRDNSQFFLGKKSVMSVALGRTKEEETAEDMHAVAQCLLSGEKRGLMFTNEQKSTVMKRKNQYEVNMLAFWSKKKGYHEL